MKTYTIPMVPGPTIVPERVLRAGMMNYGSADLEEEFYSLFQETEKLLQLFFGTKNKIVIQTGEGMVALWSALRNTLKKGDKVLAVSTGIFGSGIGEMAASIGCEVMYIEHPFNSGITKWMEIETAIQSFQPKMITAVHCETPSGVINPLTQLGELKAKYNVPLLYVDAVASVGAELIDADANHIDLCLGGSQKALSAPPNSAFLAVSDKAWDIIDEINYVGYDALKPFRNALENKYFPYTPSWVNIAQLYEASMVIMDDDFSDTIKRHKYNAAHVMESMTKMGYQPFVEDLQFAASTVSAFLIPEKYTWETFDKKLRSKGLAVGGNYGPLAGKIFRIGHMGSQSNRNLIDPALEILKDLIV